MKNLTYLMTKNVRSVFVSLIYSIVIICCSKGSVYGSEILVDWQFSGASSVYDSLLPEYTLEQVIVSSLTLGSGLKSGSAQNAFGASEWTSISKEEAIDNNQFIYFTFKPKAGERISLSKIDSFNIRRSATGPISGVLQYSVNNNPFTDLVVYNSFGANTTSAGNNQAVIKLDTVDALQNLDSSSSITFRFVNWGASSSQGTWYFNGHSSAKYPALTIYGLVTDQPLSLDLLGFSGTQREDINYLTWETANEENFSHFEVERSEDGIAFAYRERVKQRSIPDPIIYNYTDEGIDRTYYYRLKIIDLDKQFKYSHILRMEYSQDERFDYIVYPNPATKNLYFKPAKGINDVIITDLTGKVVFTSRNTFTQFFCIDVSNLSTGLYHIRIICDTKESGHYFFKK